MLLVSLCGYAFVSICVMAGTRICEVRLTVEVLSFYWWAVFLLVRSLCSVWLCLGTVLVVKRVGQPVTGCHVSHGSKCAVAVFGCSVKAAPLSVWFIVQMCFIVYMPICAFLFMFVIYIHIYV